MHAQRLCYFTFLLLLLLLPRDIRAVNYQETKQGSSEDLHAMLQHAAMQCAVEQDDVPVCASDESAFYLLPNECFYNEINSKRQETAAYMRIALRNCVEDCDLECANIYRPICGVNPATNARRTFPNRCAMAQESCRSETDWVPQESGICDVPAMRAPTKPKPAKKRKEKCTRKPIPCPRKYNPVCAMYAGVKSTFNNECLVNAENVKTKKDWRVFSQGVCAEDYASERREKYNIASEISVRSYDQNYAHNFQQAPPNLNRNGVFTQIFAPTAFQTQFFDEFGRQFTMSNQQSPLQFETQHMLHATATVPQAAANAIRTAAERAQPAKPIIVFNAAAEQDGVVEQCIYGAEPICGQYDDRMRDFSNVCELLLRNLLRNETWLYLHDGKCNACTLKCNTEYNPVCVARNGLNYTLANECYFHAASCEDRRFDWKLIDHAECQNPRAETAIVDKYATAKPGFPYTSKYAVDLTTTTTAKPTITTTTRRIKTTTRKSRRKNRTHGHSKLTRKLKYKSSASSSRRPTFKPAITSTASTPASTSTKSTTASTTTTKSAATRNALKESVIMRLYKARAKISKMRVE